MRSSISLKRVLARQWVVFTLLLCAVFIVSMFFFLYILEDHVFDSELARAAAAVRSRSGILSLPSRIQYFTEDDVPVDIRARLSQVEQGEVTEFRRGDGTYMHARWAQHEDGALFALAYDVTDRLAVTRAAGGILELSLPVVALLALCAYLLATAFVARIARQAQQLIEQVRNSSDPDALLTFAARERIHEFAELARLNAEIWQEKLQVIERERQTLAFLGHELRTPLQSARTSIALLQPDQPAESWRRLQRAVDRLGRASNAIIWLTTDAPVPAAQVTAIAMVVHELIEELRPLALRKGQTIALAAHSSPEWKVPVEAVESMLANLLLNAIQHGAAGRISVVITDVAVTVSNLASSDPSEPGSGLGLRITQRLCDRFDLLLAREACPDTAVTVRIEPRCRCAAGASAMRP